MPENCLHEIARTLEKTYQKIILLQSLSFTLSVATDKSGYNAVDFSGAAYIINNSVIDIKQDTEELLALLERKSQEAKSVQ